MLFLTIFCIAVYVNIWIPGTLHHRTAWGLHLYLTKSALKHASFLIQQEELVF